MALTNLDINEDGIDSSDQYDVTIPVDADPATNSISEASENGDLRLLRRVPLIWIQ